MQIHLKFEPIKNKVKYTVRAETVMEDKGCSGVQNFTQIYNPFWWEKYGLKGNIVVYNLYYFHWDLLITQHTV